MKRFNVTVEGHYPSMNDREYCEDGEFVDARVAEELHAALNELLLMTKSKDVTCTHKSMVEFYACRALDKADGLA